MSWESLARWKGSEIRGKDMKEETWTTFRSWLPFSSKGSKQMENLGQQKASESNVKKPPREDIMFVLDSVMRSRIDKKWEGN